METFNKEDGFFYLELAKGLLKTLNIPPQKEGVPGYIFPDKIGNTVIFKFSNGTMAQLFTGELNKYGFKSASHFSNEVEVTVKYDKTPLEMYRIDKKTAPRELAIELKDRLRALIRGKNIVIEHNAGTAGNPFYHHFSLEKNIATEDMKELLSYLESLGFLTIKPNYEKRTFSLYTVMPFVKREEKEKKVKTPANPKKEVVEDEGTLGEKLRALKVLIKKDESLSPLAESVLSLLLGLGNNKPEPVDFGKMAQALKDAGYGIVQLDQKVTVDLGENKIKVSVPVKECLTNNEVKNLLVELFRKD